MNERLEAKIENARKLQDELKSTGITAELDEKTGELKINGAEFTKGDDMYG
ncbi:hypothetical protein DFP93_101206 [Aneurinibacillus soli]|uniref:Uncharacterized protein n=1 Tax=Aneurinibacillus soli TaxID=1500254 RepID=A0A0U5B0L8_9BACL|nr:hypothetical protein [Aneurinibacillus soli]PYE64181.1 hypothetical protein DFP93_101206 [Aneurinibacillus soli]BAU28130.1 hypothetical protein CB4_02304 [Aneurinibacillus soli]